MPELQSTIIQIKEAAQNGELGVYIESQGVKLGKLYGGKQKACCPFHKENTPSFTVYANGSYKCFGCGEQGDILSFAQKHGKRLFLEAVEHLAQYFGIEMPKPSPEEAKAALQRAALLNANARAAAKYQEALQGSKAALPYLEKRGFTPEEIALWGIGSNYAVQLTANLTDPQKELLIAAGLASKKESNGTVYDFFWAQERIMFPIKDRLGNVIAFTARHLKPDGQNPKYLNTRTTELFEKSKNLYGIFEAKAAIREASEAVVVEGNTDVIAAHRGGAANTVGFLGSAFTIEQVRLLKSICKDLKSLVLIRDNDNDKGPEAQAKNIRKNIESIALMLSEGINPYIVEMPFGQDPDGYVKEHGEIANYIKENRIDGIEYALSEILKSDDKLAIAQSKSAFIKEVVSKHPDKEVRLQLEQYVREYGSSRKALKRDDAANIIQLQSYEAYPKEDANYSYFDAFGIKIDTLYHFLVDGLIDYTYSQKTKVLERTGGTYFLLSEGNNKFAYAPKESRNQLEQLVQDKADNTFCLGKSLLPQYCEYLFVWQELESLLRGFQELPQHGHVWLPEPDYLTLDFLASKAKNLVAFPATTSKGRAFAKAVGLKAKRIPLPSIEISNTFPNEGQSIVDFWQRGHSVEELISVLIAEINDEKEISANEITFEQGSMYVHLWREKLQRLEKKRISNFTLSFLGRVEGEENSRIVQLVNENGTIRKAIMPTECFVDVKHFKRFIFNEKGGTFKTYFLDAYDLECIIAQLLNDEKGIRKISRLGECQEEGVYFLSNGLISPKGEILESDDLGIVTYADKSYYLEWHSSMFRGKEDNEYITSKNIALKKGQTDFASWAKQHYSVYRENSPLFMLMGIASVFSTSIFKELKGFPMFMIEGPAGSGKSAAMNSMLALWGKAPSVSFEKGNTEAGLNDMMGFMSNGLIGLEELNSEMKPQELSALKSLFDRMKRYTKASTKEIESGFFMTGNYLPTEIAPLMDRLILVYDKEKSFSEQEKKSFSLLSGMEEKGLSKALSEIYAQKQTIKEQFKKAHQAAFLELRGAVRKAESDRSIQSNAMLLAVYDCLKGKLAFPFNRQTIVAACVRSINNVGKAVVSGGKNDFWETVAFLATREVSHDRREMTPHIEVGGHFRISESKKGGKRLLVKFKDCYTQYAKYCREIGKKQLSEQEVLRRLEAAPYWHPKKYSYKFEVVDAEGYRREKAALAYRFDYSKFYEYTGIDLETLEPSNTEEDEKAAPVPPTNRHYTEVNPATNPQNVDFSDSNGYGNQRAIFPKPDDKGFISVDF